MAVGAAVPGKDRKGSLKGLSGGGMKEEDLEGEEGGGGGRGRGGGGTAHVADKNAEARGAAGEGHKEHSRGGTGYEDLEQEYYSDE